MRAGEQTKENNVGVKESATARLTSHVVFSVTENPSSLDQIKTIVRNNNHLLI